MASFGQGIVIRSANLGRREHRRRADYGVTAIVNGNSRAQRGADWKKLGWKVGLAAVLIAAGYGGWLLIPLVVRSDFAPHYKTSLIAVLGATPLLTKFAAAALFGKEAINYLRRYLGRLWR